jgi:hypothetical protein
VPFDGWEQDVSTTVIFEAGNKKVGTTYLLILKLFLGEVMFELVEFVHFG